MSLFDKDDFYSAKRPIRSLRDPDGMKTKQFTSFRSSRESRKLLVMTSALGGAVVMLLIVLIVVSLQAANPAVTAATGVSGSKQSVNNGDQIVHAAQKISSSVVSVLSSKKNDKGELKQHGRGSGVIFEKQGNRMLVVTNNHVIEDGISFEIALNNGELKKAELVGADRISDLAVLEIEADSDAEVAEFGDSSKLRMGETVIAIGSPLGLGTSTTKGIISSPKQTIPVSTGGDGEIDWEMDMIQTDAAINEGNSGGALANMKGQIVGINTLKIANLTVEGMGFAIPSNDVMPILEDLIEHHKVKRPLIGVTMQNLQSFKGTEVLKLPADVKTGIIVLEASGPAKAAGMKSQDVIVEIDGNKVNGILQLRKYLYNEKKAGDTLTVTFYRAGKKETADVVLIES